ncbi:Protein of unknown function [Gryllus bimaculatus]|nr:Protein of unknown function [Gryllus bimaculatus]
MLQNIIELASSFIVNVTVVSKGNVCSTYMGANIFTKKAQELKFKGLLRPSSIRFKKYNFYIYLTVTIIVETVFKNYINSRTSNCKIFIALFFLH